MTSQNTESDRTKAGRSAVGFCSIALRDSPVEEAISEIARSGFSVIELWYPHIKGLRVEELIQLADVWEKNEISVSVLAPYFTFTKGLDKWRESVLLAEDVVAAARAIRAEKIRTFIDIGPDGLPSGKAKPSDWKQACQALKTICAFDRSIEFVIETHDNTLADTLDSVLRLVDETAEPNLKINFQANTDFMGRGYLECLERLWPHISHMHWQQMKPDGTATYIEEPGCIDFMALGALLARRQYQGTISVEYCWPNLERRRIATAHEFIEAINSSKRND
jgi:sugar phosphate isomerase/epimerase